MTMQKTLYWLAAGWTVAGLLGGLYYRELTKAHDFTDRTQLAVVHTHALVLGTLLSLILLVLDRVFGLSEDSQFRWAVIVTNLGVLITVVMQAVNGTRTVLRHGLVTPASLAGISGMGHITLTIGFVLLFLTLKRAVWREPAQA